MNVYNKILNFFVNGMNLSMKETNKILNMNIGTMWEFYYILKSTPF